MGKRREHLLGNARRRTEKHAQIGITKGRSFPATRKWESGSDGGKRGATSKPEKKGGGGRPWGGKGCVELSMRVTVNVGSA